MGSFESKTSARRPALAREIGDARAAACRPGPIAPPAAGGDASGGVCAIIRRCRGRRGAPPAGLPAKTAPKIGPTRPRAGRPRGVGSADPRSPRKPDDPVPQDNEKIRTRDFALVARSVASRDLLSQGTPRERERGGGGERLTRPPHPGNPMILPLTPAVRDFVGCDIAGIPVRCSVTAALPLISRLGGPAHSDRRLASVRSPAYFCFWFLDNHSPLVAAPASRCVAAARPASFSRVKPGPIGSSPILWPVSFPYSPSTRHDLP